jgi:hypothetical protein
MISEKTLREVANVSADNDRRQQHDREHEAIRAALNAMRNDMKTIVALVNHMAEQGFDAEETFNAVTQITEATA